MFASAPKEANHGHTDLMKYSRVAGTPEEALARFDERLLPAMGLEYADFGRSVPATARPTKG